MENNELLEEINIAKNKFANDFVKKLPKNVKENVVNNVDFCFAYSTYLLGNVPKLDKSVSEYDKLTMRELVANFENAEAFKKLNNKQVEKMLNAIKNKLFEAKGYNKGFPIRYDYFMPSHMKELGVTDYFLGMISVNKNNNHEFEATASLENYLTYDDKQEYAGLVVLLSALHEIRHGFDIMEFGKWFNNSEIENNLDLSAISFVFSLFSNSLTNVQNCEKSDDYLFCAHEMSAKVFANQMLREFNELGYFEENDFVEKFVVQNEIETYLEMDSFKNKDYMYNVEKQVQLCEKMIDYVRECVNPKLLSKLRDKVINIDLKEYKAMLESEPMKVNNNFNNYAEKYVNTISQNENTNKYVNLLNQYKAYGEYFNFLTVQQYIETLENARVMDGGLEKFNQEVSKNEDAEYFNEVSKKIENKVEMLK